VDHADPVATADEVALFVCEIGRGEALFLVVAKRLTHLRIVGRQRAKVPLDDLTERERELVAWVATGRSNEEIGQALFISPATVRTHVGRAMLKLHARDRAQLVVFAVQSGLTIPASRDQT